MALIPKSLDPSTMATTTLLSSSFSMPAAAAAARRSTTASASSLGFATSQLAGLSLGVSTSTTAAVGPLPKQQLQPIVARRVCPFTGKKTNRANKVSFSNHKTKTQQFVNLQYKKLWWEAGKRFVKLRLSTKALKTIEKHGLDAVARKAGIDLNKK
ncbi:large ribosomal subunit protein bL28c-like [Phragmites australis]|uniref:large ribosomal subunit protein bL28c-like n=1 Tax=Phragmites australis TaxID=29695 RepID=UPI002D7A0CCD|nr:large ribosomal subunit protein bL28c-like [Phragmites australis]